jgi:hypothetical protein
MFWHFPICVSSVGICGQNYLTLALTGWLHGPWPWALLAATRNQHLSPLFSPVTSQDWRMLMATCFHPRVAVGAVVIWMRNAQRRTGRFQRSRTTPSNSVLTTRNKVGAPGWPTGCLSLATPTPAASSAAGSPPVTAEMPEAARVVQSRMALTFVFRLVNAARKAVFNTSLSICVGRLGDLGGDGKLRNLFGMFGGQLADAVGHSSANGYLFENRLVSEAEFEAFHVQWGG